MNYLNKFKEQYNKQSDKIVADSGYGSEENYDYPEKENIKSYVEFNYFHKEKKKTFKTDPHRLENLQYNEQGDCFICPMGQKMGCMGKYEKPNNYGYVSKIKKYQAQNCRSYSINNQYFGDKEDRIIKINHNLRRHKSQARKKLNSPKGLTHRS